ncbi:OstA-like protein [Gracilimonas sp.]|uniref:OstA-like protein n=1 Tax=Gracilimonas sp. TaxID=1974203 RepID=UPI002872376A|nr:OstA-like protein [Gracilimonas sp.]
MSNLIRISLLFSITLLMVSGFATSNSHAQDVVQIDYAREATVITENGESIRKMYDARLKTGNVTMVVDSAWQYIQRNQMHAFGNIQIETPDEWIWTDTLYYDINEELSQLRGRVIIRQDSTTLFGESVDYNFLTKVAFFNKGIRLEDTGGTLIAKRGTYFQNQDSAIFKGNVQIADTAQYAEGDSLFINRKTEFLQLYSNVLVADSSNNGLLTGDFLEADSTGRRFVDGNAYLRRISADTTDTTHINSNQALLLEQDSTNLIKSYGNVKVYGPNFSSVSDTLLYNSSTEIFELISNPIAWHNNIQLTGPYITVQMDSNQIRQLTAYHQTFVVQEDSTTGRLNQIKGDTLITDFMDGELSRILIYPNSQVLYHTANEQGESDGAVEYSSPRTIMAFKDGELERVVAGKNSGYFFEEFEGLADRKLDGFSWNPERKPQKPRVLIQPRFSPVPTVRPFELPRRYLEFLETNSDQIRF